MSGPTHYWLKGRVKQKDKRRLVEQFVVAIDEAAGETLESQGYAAFEATPLPRALEKHESVTKDGAIVRDDEAAIDEAHVAAHGREAIGLAHLRKAIEARALLAEASILQKAQIAARWPMLAAEADATGDDLIELARAVITKDDEMIATETARRAAKTRARA